MASAHSTSLDRPRLAALALVGATLATLFVACGDDADGVDGDGGGILSCAVDDRECDTLCDEGLGCVECLADTDCGASAPACAHGRCRECGSNADCGAGEACFPKDGTCEPACETDDDCDDGDERTCDLDPEGIGRCVECLSDEDCDGDDPRCDDVTGQCVDCTSNADCGAAEPACDLREGKCRECNVDADCRSGSVCRGDHKCHDFCESDLDCDDGQLCRTDDGDCVECLVDTDCGTAAPHCNEKEKCVECLVNDHCTDETQPFCHDDKECVQCRDDEDCGDPDFPKCKDRQCEAD